MITISFILVNLIMIVIYIMYPKRLHPIQAAAVYMIGLIYTHDYLVIPIYNLEAWEVTKSIEHGLIITLNAVIAVPIFAVLLVEIFMKSRHYINKAITVVAWVTLLVLFEYVHHWLGMVKIKHWEMSWSFTIFFILAILLVISAYMIKKMLTQLGEIT